MKYSNEIIEQDKISQKLFEIMVVLKKNVNSLKDLSFFEGKAGISLLFCLYGRFFNDPYFSLKGQDILIDNIFDEIQKSKKIQFSFCNGLAGIGWVYEYMNLENLIDADSNKTLIELDNYLLKIFTILQKTQHWDYLHGSIGIATYFLKRLNNQPLFADLLTQFIKDLEKSAIRENGYLKWYTIIRNYNEPMEPNIGFSHGAAGIIVFLSKLKKKGITSELIDDMISSSLAFINSNEFPIDNIHRQKSYFPQYSLESKHKIYHSRLGWCYGDLGIAISLWEAGCILNDNKLKEKSVTIFKSSFKRKEPLDNFVTDACICHGSSGISLMTQRMFFNTNDKDFIENINYWITQTLNYSNNEDGICGFKFWSGRKNKFTKNYSLLGGITGVGLSLLSHLAFDKEFQNWDECLLLC